MLCTGDKKEPPWGGSLLILESAAGAVAAISGACAIGGEELADGEFDLTEDFAGIFGGALLSAGAFFFGHTVVVRGHQQVGIALQADDGELAKRNEKPSLISAEDQVITQGLSNGGGDLCDAAIAGTAVAYVDQLQTQDNGINGFKLSGRQSLNRDEGSGCIFPGGKDLGTALAAKQDGALVKDRQTTNLYGAGGTGKSIGGDAVEVAYVNGKESSIKVNGLYVDVGTKQLCVARFDRHRAVKDFLRSFGGVDAKIFNAVFGLAGIENLLCVYAHGFPDAMLVADGPGDYLIGHLCYLLHWVAWRINRL